MPKREGYRGLGNLFDEAAPEEKNGVTMLKLADVEPKKDQPRKQFEAEPLSQLAESIAQHGVLQPIIVRPATQGMYEIIAGERRWRASRLAGLSEIPAIVMEADELKAAQVALIENIQRENLNPFEEAGAYDELMRTYGMSQEEVAAKLGKSRSAVANAVRLLDLPDEVSELIRAGKLSAGHGRTLLGLKNRDVMLPLANKIIKRNLSVRETEAAVKRENRQLAQGDDSPVIEGVTVNYIEELERRVTSITGKRVRIISGKGRHVVQIEYADNGDLEELLERICGAKITEYSKNTKSTGSRRSRYLKGQNNDRH